PRVVRTQGYRFAIGRPLRVDSLNSDSFLAGRVPMERPIAYDKLAREDRWIRMRAREVAELKVAQGFPPFADLSTPDSIRERVHGILVGEMQAMEGAGRTVCDFPDVPWEFTMDMARQVWDESRHVRMGSKWLTKLTEGDPERRRKAIEFQETIDERFNLGGVRREGDHEAVSISIATDVRRMAGFTEEEIERLVRTTQRSQVY